MTKKYLNMTKAEAARAYWLSLTLEERQRRTKAAHARYRANPAKRAIERKWRERPEVKAKILATSARFHRDNWEHRTYLCAKRRAAELGVPFSIAESDILVPKTCPILGIELRIGSKSGSRRGGSADSPSMDRKIPSLGYVPGNVFVISLRANALKNSATLEELKALVKYCTG